MLNYADIAGMVTTQYGLIAKIANANNLFKYFRVYLWSKFIIYICTHHIY